MKKLLALLLALIMVLSLFAGCGKTETPAKTEEPAKTETPAKTEEKKEEPAKTEEPAKDESWKEEHPGWLCEEKTTLSVYTWEGVSSSFLPPSNDLYFWQFMEDYTNVHIEWEVVPYADYNTLVAAKVSSGEPLNDIINLGAQISTTQGAGDNGMLVDLAPHWEEWFPYMSSMYADLGIPYNSNVTNSDGTMYAITTFAAPQYNRIIPLFRTDWLDAIGAEVPTTIDEFTQVLRDLKAAGDLNGNGQDDEIIFTATSVDWLLPGIGTAFGVENIESCDFYSAGADGVVYPEYTTENMKAMLAWLNMLYDEGILDAEITTNTMDIVAEKVTADRVAVVIMYASFATSYGNLTPKGQIEENKNTEIYSLGKPMTSEYCPTPKMTMYENYGMFTCISSACENPELAARWLDALYADPNVMNVRCCGEEGVNWQMGADGNPEIIMPADGSAWNIKDKGCGQLSLPYIQTDLQLNFSKTATAKWYVDNYNANYIDGCEWAMPSVPKVPGYTEEEAEIRDMFQTDLTAGWNEYRDKFITGALDTETDWEDYGAYLEALGMNEMCEMYQMVYDRTH